jgi:6-phospho-beta-glucosidase
MVHRITCALEASPAEVRCEYIGLNHLGWVRKVELRGADVTSQLLGSDGLLDQLHTGPLFDHELMRSLKLIPTEYLYFYYSRQRALANQKAHNDTRGTAIGKLNHELFRRLGSLLSADDAQDALAAYIEYLNARSGTYMLLESTSENAIPEDTLQEDPFRAASGYHRIALDVMKALRGKTSQRLIVNVRNQGAIADLRADDVVEVPCSIADGAISPEPCGALPSAVKGLVLAVKEYERVTIEAAMTRSKQLARKAMLIYPAIGEWEPSAALLRDLRFGG